MKRAISVGLVALSAAPVFGQWLPVCGEALPRRALLRNWRDPIVRFCSPLGAIDFELEYYRAPTTVVLFLQAVADEYADGSFVVSATASSTTEPASALFGGQIRYDPLLNSLVSVAATVPAPGETSGLSNVAGTLSLVRESTNPGVGSSRWRMNVVDNPQADPAAGSVQGSHVFGRVVQGMEVLQQVAQLRRFDIGQTPPFLSVWSNGLRGVPLVDWYDSAQPATTQDIIMFDVNTVLLCAADFDDGSGSGTPDGGVTVEDLNFFLDRFDEGDPVCDIDDGSGTGRRDWGVTVDDLVYFLSRYDLGC